MIAAGLDDEAADAAIAYALEQGRLITDVAEDEPPHSLCFTDDGRVETSRARTAFKCRKRPWRRCRSRFNGPKRIAV